MAEMTFNDIISFLKRSADKAHRQFVNGDLERAMKELKWVNRSLDMAFETLSKHQQQQPEEVASNG